MFTRIDHVMICVPDLPRGMEQYRKMGFNIHAGGVHPGKGTHNAIAFLRDDYIELLAIRDLAEHQAAAGPGSTHADLARFITAGGGIRYVILQSDDLAAEVAAMRSRGVDVSDVMDGGRRTPAGQELRWKAAALGTRNPLPVFFIQHVTPIAGAASSAGRRQHPNGVTPSSAPTLSFRMPRRRSDVRQSVGTASAATTAGHGDHGGHGGVPVGSHGSWHRPALR
jgi:hypothetical protein